MRAALASLACLSLGDFRMRTACRDLRATLVLQARKERLAYEVYPLRVGPGPHEASCDVTRGTDIRVVIVCAKQ
jgi:hypothetical protein